MKQSTKFLTICSFILLLSSSVFVVEAFGRKGMDMELLLLKLLSNRSKKQQVVPIPIYIPRCRAHGSHHRAETHHYPVYIPIHTHEHHVMDTSDHYNYAPSSCQSGSCSSSSLSPIYASLSELSVSGPSSSSSSPSSSSSRYNSNNHYYD